MYLLTLTPAQILCSHIPYTIKRSRGKTFAVFTVFCQPQKFYCWKFSEKFSCFVIRKLFWICEYTYTALLKYFKIGKRHSGLPIKSNYWNISWHVAYCIPTFLNGHCIAISWICFFLLTRKLLSNYRCPIVLVHMISVNRTIGFEFFCHPVYAILSAHVKIIIIFAHILKQVIVGKRWKFSLHNEYCWRTAKVFPLKCFIVYGIIPFTEYCFINALKYKVSYSQGQVSCWLTTQGVSIIITTQYKF